MTQKDQDSYQPAQLAKLGLEEIVFLANKIGLEYVQAKKEADKLDLMKATVRAQIAARLDTGDLTETKLRRLCDMDLAYVEFLTQLNEAKSESEKLKIRYESYKNLFEAKRSLLSYQKAEMKLI